MGLKNTTTPSSMTGTKLSIVGGKFTLRVQEGTDGAESRILTKGPHAGEAVYELKYPAIEGYIVNGGIIDGEYPGVDIEVEDGSESFVISFPLESRYLFELIKRLPNVNITEKVSIELQELSKKSRTGNPLYRLNVIQGGRQLQDFYTEWKKDETGKNVATLLHGMPDAEQTRKGWDFTKQEDFLLGKLEEFFGNSEPTAEKVLKDAGFVEADDDGVPF